MWTPGTWILAPDPHLTLLNKNCSCSFCLLHLLIWHLDLLLCCCVAQGSTVPRLWTSTGPRLVRNRAAQQVSGGWESKASSVLTAAPHRSLYCLSSTSCQISRGIRFSGGANPTVNCACEGSRSHTLYENLMPDDLGWSWGGDASAGEWLQIHIIISRGLTAQRPK